AYVRCRSVADASKAVEYNLRMIGKRYVEIFRSSEQELVDSLEQHGVRDFSAGLVRCRGLPFSCTVASVIQLFEGFDVSEEQVTLGLHFSGPFAGSQNGEALVALDNEETARRALAERNMMVVGQRYVELYLTSEVEARQFAVPAALDSLDDETKLPNRLDVWQVHSCILRARGIPFSSGC
ncbi:unnamed protein product, partial [Polarella glacialis]